MTYQSKVTVILTSYNHDKYIKESIDSVLNQSYPDFELIIIDDGSTDNSWQIINNYSDPRIRAFRSEVNKGRPLEIIPEHLSGEYIAIHHSDDAWEPSKLEKQVAFLDNNPDVAAVFTHVQVIDEEGQPFTDEKNFYYKVFDQPNRTRYEWLHYFFYEGNALCHPSILFRAYCYDDIQFRKGLVQLPDFDTWVQLCFHHEIYIIQEKLTRFRIRENEANISGNRPDSRLRWNFELLKFLDHYKMISSVEELLNIFPQAERYINKNNADLLYALGIIAVDSGNKPPYQLFCLNLLFEALNDPKRMKLLKKYQLFNEKDFLILTAKNDMFNTESVLDLSHQLEKRNEQLQQLELQINKRDQRIKEFELQINKRDQRIKEFELQINKRDQRIKEFELQINKRDQRIKEFELQINKRDQRIEEFELQNNTREQQLQILQQEILYYALSKSWRITRPLRKIMKVLKGKSIV